MSGSEKQSSARLSSKLRFSGWVQFLFAFAIALPLAALAWAGFALGAGGTAAVLAGLAGLFALLGVLDVAIGKLGLIALPERRPAPIDGKPLAALMARRTTRAFHPVPLSDTHRTLVQDRLEFHTAIDSAEAIAQGRMRAVLVEKPLVVFPGYGAQSFIVVLGPKTYDRLSVIEAGRAVQHVVNEATAAGIATGWIGPGAQRASVQAALGDAFDGARDHVLCVVALGYPARYVPLFLRVAALSGAKRKPLADLIFEEAPGLPAPLTRAPYKALLPAFEACRRAPSSYNAQSTRMILSATEKEVTKAQICALEGSQYYAPLALGIWCANWETAMEALGQPGRWVRLEAARPIAGGLVHDLSWKPLPVAAQAAP